MPCRRFLSLFVPFSRFFRYCTSFFPLTTLRLPCLSPLYWLCCLVPFPHAPCPPLACHDQHDSISNLSFSCPWSPRQLWFARRHAYVKGTQAKDCQDEGGSPNSDTRRRPSSHRKALLLLSRQQTPQAACREQRGRMAFCLFSADARRAGRAR